MSLCQHIVKDEEVEGMIDGGAHVIANCGVDVGKGLVNIRRRQYGGGEVSL